MRDGQDNGTKAGPHQETRSASLDKACRHHTVRRTPASKITNSGNIGYRGHVIVGVRGLVAPAELDWVPGLIVLAHDNFAFPVHIVRDAVA